MKLFSAIILMSLFALNASAMESREIHCSTKYWTANQQPLVVTATIYPDASIANVLVMTAGVGEDVSKANELVVKVAGPVSKRANYKPRNYVGYEMYVLSGSRSESMDILLPAYSALKPRFEAYASDYGTGGEDTQWGHSKLLCSVR